MSLKKEIRKNQGGNWLKLIIQTMEGVIVANEGDEYCLEVCNNEQAIILSIKGPVLKVADDLCSR